MLQNGNCAFTERWEAMSCIFSASTALSKLPTGQIILEQMVVRMNNCADILTNIKRDVTILDCLPSLGVKLQKCSEYFQTARQIFWINQSQMFHKDNATIHNAPAHKELPLQILQPNYHSHYSPDLVLYNFLTFPEDISAPKETIFEIVEKVKTKLSVTLKTFSQNILRPCFKSRVKFVWSSAGVEERSTLSVMSFKCIICEQKLGHQFFNFFLIPLPTLKMKFSRCTQKLFFLN